MSKRQERKHRRQFPRNIRKSVEISSGRTKGYDATWAKVLRQVSGEAHGETRKEWIDWRLSQTGHADEASWKASLLSSENPDLLSACMEVAHRDSHSAYTGTLFAIAQNETMRSDVRAQAIRHYALFATFEELANLCDLLSSDTPLDEHPHRWTKDPSHPFYNHWMAQTLRSRKEERDASEHAIKLAKTIGEGVVATLQEVTGQDFGSDPVLWREWLLEEHEKRGADGYSRSVSWTSEGFGSGVDF